MRKELLSVFGGLLLNGLTSKNKKGRIESRAVTIGSDNYTYQVFIPSQVEDKSNLPVIVFLHGIRERGTGGYLPTEGVNGNLLRHYLSQVPAIVLLPQCQMNKYWPDPAMDEMVMRALEKTISEFKADAKRIYLIGVSMGGYGVWHFASEHINQFAALVSICGGSPIMTGDRFTPIAEKIGKTPTWVFHGAADPIVPVSESREMIKAIEKNGGDVKYSEYEGVGHNVWLNVLAEKNLIPWLLSKKMK